MGCINNKLEEQYGGDDSGLRGIADTPSTNFDP